MKRLGTVTKTRPVSVNAAQTEQNDQSKQTDQIKQTQVDTELQANRAAILELTAQVASFAQHFARVVKPTEPVTNVNPCPPST